MNCHTYHIICKHTYCVYDTDETKKTKKKVAVSTPPDARYDILIIYIITSHIHTTPYVTHTSNPKALSRLVCFPHLNRRRVSVAKILHGPQQGAAEVHVGKGLTGLSSSRYFTVVFLRGGGGVKLENYETKNKVQNQLCWLTTHDG